MSQKDFTDWNGRKRKEVVRPAPERDHRWAGNKEHVGIKIKVDRYRALLKELARYRKWRQEEWSRRQCDPWNWGQSIRWKIKKIRKLQDEYRKDGSLDRVLEIVRGKP